MIRFAHLDLGIFCHSFQQILSRSVKNGDHRWTDVFRFLQKCLFGFKSSPCFTVGILCRCQVDVMVWSLFKRGMVGLIYFLFCWMTFSLIRILVWYHFFNACYWSICEWFICAYIFKMMHSILWTNSCFCFDCVDQTFFYSDLNTGQGVNKKTTENNITLSPLLLMNK